MGKLNMNTQVFLIALIFTNLLVLNTGLFLKLKKHNEGEKTHDENKAGSQKYLILPEELNDATANITILQDEIMPKDANDTSNTTDISHMEENKQEKLRAAAELAYEKSHGFHK